MQNSDFLSGVVFSTTLLIHLELDNNTTKGFGPFIVLDAEMSR